MSLPPLPEPVAWFRAPYGTLEPNPLFRVTGPQTLEWAVACFTEDQLRAAVAAARLAALEEAEAVILSMDWPPCNYDPLGQRGEALAAAIRALARGK